MNSGFEKIKQALRVLLNRISYTFFSRISVVKSLEYHNMVFS
ncbi:MULTISPECIES: hypothetical protein [Pseudomonas]|nr:MULTISPECIES: hypothetical protein [Pseudomonas]MDT8921608.1 hypothetical protein [Pseudomonas taiwanensis]